MFKILLLITLHALLWYTWCVLVLWWFCLLSNFSLVGPIAFKPQNHHKSRSRVINKAICTRFGYYLVQWRTWFKTSYHFNFKFLRLSKPLLLYNMISGKAFALFCKIWWTPILNSEWMCMTQWYQGLLIWSLLYKSKPQTIWHSNCLYRLRNSNVSGAYTGLWLLSKSLYQT